MTHEEREALVQQVFRRITIDGKEFVDIEPKPEYAPLFATMLTAQKVGYRELESTLALQQLTFYHRPLTETNNVAWLLKAA